MKRKRRTKKSKKMMIKVMKKVLAHREQEALAHNRVIRVP
jgi:hypothetical protein